MAVFKYKNVTYDDRASADRRMLCYTSAPLARDTEITGYPIVTLHVTSTETDGAFFVYLDDVDETGRSTYVTEGQLRAINRKVSPAVPPYRIQVPYHSYQRADAQPLTPGVVAELTFGMQPTSVLFHRGHHIRFAIAGHDEGTFRRLPAQGTPTITVARNQVHASYIDLPMRERA